MKKKILISVKFEAKQISKSKSSKIKGGDKGEKLCPSWPAESPW